METIQHYQLKRGLNLYYIPAKKFKTTFLSINIHNELTKEHASECALLSDVLGRGNKMYPSESAISTYLQELYGASFSVDVRRKGNDQILSLAATTVNEQYLPVGEKCFEDVLSFLFDMLLDPYLENGVFSETYVAQEKINLINDIQALINEKRAYSVWRLIENMCEGDSYAVHELGTVADVEAITPQSLYTFYHELLKSGPIDIMVTGDVDIESVCSYVLNRFSAIELKKDTRPVPALYQKSLGGREVVETFDVTQAKLCLGYKTSVEPTSDDYYKLMVYNSILGGGAHCKLFNEVREKLSLAYYAGSKIERFKGLLLISAGIEMANKQKALDEIFAQVELMKQGKFSDVEFDVSVKSIVNSLRSIADSIGYLTDFYLGQTITDGAITLEEYIEKIQAVTKEDVIAIAQNVELEMIYFLTGKEKEEA